MFSVTEQQTCLRLIELALAEDLGDAGDLTSQALVPIDARGQAALVARVAGVVAGLSAIVATFHRVDPELLVNLEVADGTALQPGMQLATVVGAMRSILTGERIALNFVQRLSGVATLTRHYVEAVADYPALVLDTRKTTPGWRLLEKYAVRCGGGHNHRIGLYDGVLIKDNHLAALVTEVGKTAIHLALERARLAYGTQYPIEIEVDSLEQLDQALAETPDIVLLDNMNVEQLTEAVRRRNARGPSVRLEASGGVNLTTIRGIAATGVDRISVGALTHSAVALDIGLDYLA